MSCMVKIVRVMVNIVSSFLVFVEKWIKFMCWWVWLVLVIRWVMILRMGSFMCVCRLLVLWKIGCNWFVVKVVNRLILRVLVMVLVSSSRWLGVIGLGLVCGGLMIWKLVMLEVIFSLFEMEVCLCCCMRFL